MLSPFSLLVVLCGGESQDIIQILANLLSWRWWRKAAEDIINVFDAGGKWSEGDVMQFANVVFERKRCGRRGALRSALCPLLSASCCMLSAPFAHC
jgi:hypothetical protein